MRANPRPATIATLALSFDGGAIVCQDTQQLINYAIVGYWWIWLNDDCIVIQF
jgi:hypothetical protein